MPMFLFPEIIIASKQELLLMMYTKSQVEGHPYFRNESVIRFCKDNKIHVTVRASALKH